MNRIATLATSLVIASAAGTALANAEHHKDAAAPAASAQAQSLSEGVVRKVDKDSGKLTIKHGPLENLGMPGMTMVFHVKDPAMLDEVKEGDSIRFRAEQVNGALTVTQLQAAR